jgi:DNA-binding GntR family transcriptional regulator
MTREIKNRTLSSVIAERLRQEILDGTHASGAQLRQDALAAAFGVSRIPLREAFFQLEAEGLLQIIPHKGAIVTTLSPLEINDVFDLRAVLEPRLLKHSIPNLTDQDFEELTVIQSQFSVAIESKDLRVWGSLNAQLHMTLYSRSQLTQTASIVAALLQKSDRYTRVQLSSAAAMKRAESEHAELIDLCKKRETKAACELLWQHIDAVRIDLLGLLKCAGQAKAKA